MVKQRAIAKLNIQGQTFDLIVWPKGSLTTRADGYEGKYKIVAKIGDEEFPISVIQNAKRRRVAR